MSKGDAQDAATPSDITGRVFPQFRRPDCGMPSWPRTGSIDPGFVPVTRAVGLGHTCRYGSPVHLHHA
jgi:hypothetical protein